MPLSRRDFMRNASIAAAGAGLALRANPLSAQSAGERPSQRPATIEVLHPQNRIPVSLIIDDSTCLVNMAHFGIPQFAAVFPEQYKQPWRELPREIPDSFVRQFAEWCHEHGIKGKYSIVPYPACVGWVDRELPGWSLAELQNSLELIRTLIIPDWDIHPEMVSHTRVINTKTGRPYEQYTEYYMENWRWTDGKSVDQLADYMSYALRILKNAGLPCEGITTPGGFGNRVLPELAQATLESCRDVFGAEIPHYFRHLFTDDTSVAPRVEYASGLDSNDPQCVVSIIGCTGDWFGGWDGLKIGSPDLFITEDLQSGRLPEVISRGEPAIIVCHWPGMYCNGDETGFNIFKTVVQRLHARYDHLIWMKLSDIARYWAAKELTSIVQKDNRLVLQAPFASPSFTIRYQSNSSMQPMIVNRGQAMPLQQVSKPLDLKSGFFLKEQDKVILCFDLVKGQSEIITG
jgi:hypothetical protein